MNSPVRPDRPWQRSTSTDDSDFIDLKKIWHAVWSRKWCIVLLVAVNYAWVVIQYRYPQWLMWS